MLRSLLLALGILVAPTAAQDVEVLFLGNSYTATNDLPEVFGFLANSGGYTVVTDQHTPGGFTLGSPQGGDPPHMSNLASLALIDSNDWDYVVLQEQSATPVITFTRTNYMFPAVQSLDAAIKANDSTTTTLLFQTWARKDTGAVCWGGNCSADFTTFHQMQDALTAGYRAAAGLVGAQVSPVGEAWRLARTNHPSIQLFDPDGTHPSSLGTYLAACVFYARIFDESPIGLSYGPSTFGLEARTLQRVAHEAVFGPECGFGDFGRAGALQTLALTASGTPVLGGTVSLEPSNLPSAASGAWVLSSAGVTSLPLLGGELLVDPARRLLKPRFVPAGSAWTVPIPDDPQLAGFAVHFQALALTSAPTTGHFSPGLRVRVCP